MSEIKKHYMRAKRQTIQEENCVDGLPNIDFLTTKKSSFEPNINVSTSNETKSF